MSADSEPPSARRATISLVLGTLAFLALFFFPFASIILGVPAATNGILARREFNATENPGGGRSVADYGLAAGIVSVIFAIAVVSWDIFN